MNLEEWHDFAKVYLIVMSIAGISLLIMGIIAYIKEGLFLFFGLGLLVMILGFYPIAIYSLKKD